MLMMDSPNAESVWPSRLLNTEKNIMKITISSNLWFQWVEFQSFGRNPITLQFKWKLLFCGAADYSPVVLFIVLYKVVVTFQCVDEILWCDHSNESYSEQYFPVVLFIMLYKVVLTFGSEDEILKCDHSNESYWAVLSCGTVYYAVQGGSNFWIWGWNPMVWPFKWKLLSSTFLWYCLLCCTRWF